MNMEQSKITILAISDTHSQLTLQDLEAMPKADILIHAGDFTQDCQEDELQQFEEILKELKGIQKVIIPGNHEHIFNQEIKHNQWHQDDIQKWRDKFKQVSHFQSFGLIQIKGINILAMAQGEEYFCRHFDLFPHFGEQVVQKYKGKVDVLVTHYPPYGILDSINLKTRGGSKGLLNFVRKIKPKIHIFGHIHQAYGSIQLQGIQFYNAAYLDRSYKPKNKPFLITLPLHPSKKQEST